MKCPRCKLDMVQETQVNPTRLDAKNGDWTCWYCFDRDQQDIARRDQEMADRAEANRRQRE